MELTDLGQKPIREDSPAGEDIRLGSEFEQLQQEIDKLSIVSTEDLQVDWKRVQELSTTLLSEQSKDLLVAAYLAAALLESQQVNGLITGLTVLGDLVSNFWETLFPPKKRLRGRLNAISWFRDRTERFLTTTKIAPQPEETLATLRERIEALDQSLSSLTEDAPTLSMLIQQVNMLPVKQVAPPKPEPTSAPAPAPAAAPAPAPRPVAAPPPPAALETDADAAKLLQASFKQMLKVADFMRGKNPSAPLPYRLTRIAAWLQIDSVPSAAEGKTIIPPPDSTIKSTIEGLLNSKRYAEAIQAAESNVSLYLFWLDLSRMTAQALEGLGPSHQQALEALCSETAQYRQRMPGIESLTFADGTPFADRETLTWLKQLGPAMAAEAPLTEAAPGEGPEAEVTAALDSARSLLREKKLNEAMDLLQEGVDRAPSGRLRMLWRIALARLLLDGAPPELARPNLEAILGDLDGFKTEAWEPDMALRGLLVIHDGLTELSDQPSWSMAQEVLDRIARISPSTALKRLSKAK